jgi:hypothetical protein
MVQVTAMFQPQQTLVHYETLDRHKCRSNRTNKTGGKAGQKVNISLLASDEYWTENLVPPHKISYDDIVPPVGM